ncbi:MAG: hypothetical protein HY301_19705 [Verrucomicrobia bacterium]|nr:hypothetical protein [Verrucomicrobiota bacterium]
MKLKQFILIFVFLWCVAFTGFAQGTITAKNFASGGGPGGSTTFVNAPITNWNGVLALGSGFFAQIYAGSNAGALNPVGIPIAFSAVIGGTFNGGSLAIPGFPIGSTPTMVVRAWDNQGGSITNYFDVTGEIARGESAPFTAVALGDALTPGTIPVLQGMNGFMMVPEPSVITLASLGGLGLLLRLRRKQ